MKKYYETNKKWIEKNKEKISEYRKKYYQLNKDKTKLYNKEYHKDNRGKRVEYVKKRKQTDPLFKLSINIRNSIRFFLKKKGYIKKSKTQEILGCSFEELKLHLESKFESWMNWENYGLYIGEKNFGWDIDHIMPMATALTEGEIIKLNNYTNLQPLCSYLNRNIKKDNII